MLLIPFASPGSEAGRAALASIELPQLDRWVARSSPLGRDDGEAASLSPPHERAHARALGLAGADGLLPWAALDAHAAGLQAAGRAWGRLTPVHWQVGTDGVTLLDPASLELTEADSRALLAALAELFGADGYEVAWRAADRWLVSHPSLGGLPTASLDRAIGRDVAAWLPPRDGARGLRRLQNEAQMLLHGHPVNEAREAAGLLPVNSIWLSGCGRLDAAPPPNPGLRLDDRLRAPALAEDWAGWTAAWHALDAGSVGPLLEGRGGGERLVLCGERSAVELAAPRTGLWQRLASRWQRASAAALLETL